MSAFKSGEKRKAALSADKVLPNNGTKKPRLENNASARKYDEKKKTPWQFTTAEKARSSGKIFSGTKNRKPSDFVSSEGKKQPNGATSDGNTFERSGESSKESHLKQKQLAKERRAAKPLAEELVRAKKLWERLRRKSHVPKDERQTLVDELFSITTGRVADFVLKHDAVRAVQTAVKYSTPQQRKGIAKELQGAYGQLAESKYAKFLIGKLLVQNDGEIRDIIISEFYGKVRRMINHPEASWILDDVYRGVATKQQKARLLREWYGPEFALLNASDRSDEETADLYTILETDVSKRGAMLKHLLGMVNGLVQKNMTGFTMLHDAMLQYFLNVPAGSEDQKGFMEMIKGDESGDLLKNMAFTASGARLVCLLLAHGNAKDRKQILRTFKDTFRLMSGDAHGHKVILAAYDLIDDTVLTSKSILPEILGRNEGSEVDNIIFCANDLNARTTALYLFEGGSKSLFPASHASDLAVLEEIHEIRKTTSKKDAETRRKELIAAMSPVLLAAIAAAPHDLVATSFGCQFVTNVLLFATGDKTEALNAIAQTAASDSMNGGGASLEGGGGNEIENGREHVSQSLFGTRLLKTLVAGGRFDRESGQVKPVEPPLDFANRLYLHLRDQVMKWATGPASSFVVVALLEASDLSAEHAAELKKTLSKKANRKALEKAASEETADQKAKREAAEAAETAKSSKAASEPKLQKQKATAAKVPKWTIGNAGARLLLEKL